MIFVRLSVRPCANTSNLASTRALNDSIISFKVWDELAIWAPYELFGPAAVTKKLKKNWPNNFRQKIAAFSGKTLKNCWTWNAHNFTSRTPFRLIYFLKLGKIVRRTQICNLFWKIWPPNATEIKTNCVVVHRKNPEKLQILKPQYLDLPDSVSDDFFF